MWFVNWQKLSFCRFRKILFVKRLRKKYLKITKLTNKTNIETKNRQEENLIYVISFSSINLNLHETSL